MTNTFLLFGAAVVGITMLAFSCWQNLPLSCTSFEIDGITANACVSAKQANAFEDHLQALGDKMAASVAKYEAAK